MPAASGPLTHAGQPSHHLTLANGDRLLVALHGGHLLSWRAAGRERLYLSPRAVFDGQAAIRGGVPVCWPQFNARGPLCKHGFARHRPWSWDGAALDPNGDGGALRLRLQDDAHTRALWPHAFVLTLTLALQPGRLTLQLAVYNPGPTAWCFTGALHTYLRLDAVADARLSGLRGRPEWDALTDRRQPAPEALCLAGPFDRVYGPGARPLRLQDGDQVLAIEQSGWSDTVVWNPGACGAAALADLPTEDHAHLLCVEAAQVDTPVELAPGATWQGNQTLALC